MREPVLRTSPNSRPPKGGRNRTPQSLTACAPGLRPRLRLTAQPSTNASRQDHKTALAVLGQHNATASGATRATGLRPPHKGVPNFRLTGWKGMQRQANNADPTPPRGRQRFNSRLRFAHMPQAASRPGSARVCPTKSKKPMDLWHLNAP